MKTLQELKTQQDEVYQAMTKAYQAVTAENKAALRNLWRQDLCLIPKRARVWINIGLMAYISVISIALPAYWALTTYRVTDICLDAIMIGLVADLMLGLFTYRAIRSGKVPQDVITGPITKAYQAIRGFFKAKKTAIVALAILGLATGTALAEVDTTSSAADKRAWQEQQERDSGLYQVESKATSVREFNESIDKVHNQEQATLDRIKRTGTEGYDNRGLVKYTTPDGVDHGFSDGSGNLITREQYEARAKDVQQFRKDNIYQHEMTMSEIDAKLAASKKRLDQQQVNSENRTRQLAVEIERSRQEQAEIERQMAETKARNQAAADKAGLTPWDDFHTKEKDKDQVASK